MGTANVNWVINSCQRYVTVPRLKHESPAHQSFSIGYQSVRDPGPPKDSYSCSSATLFDDGPRCQKNPSSQTTSQRRHIESLPTATALRESTSMATSTQSSIRDPSLKASLDPNKSDDGQSSDSGGLSTGVKVAIGLTSLVGVLLVSLAVFCVLRYRSRPPHRRPNFSQLIKRNVSPLHGDSPTPLISPTTSHAGPDEVPLTPPPPLKERKMLDVGTSSRPSSSGQPRARAGFPASPVFAPTASKLVPRSERTPKSHGAGFSPPTSPLGWMATADGSLKSFSSNPTTTTSVISATATSSSERIPSTPGRSQRPREPAQDRPSPGPPPMHALPSTPPNGPATQPSTAASSMRHGDIGVAIGVVMHSPANGVSKKESRALCEMTERYGAGGGGPGATMSPPRREEHSPVMQEQDLEMLGGRY